MHSALLKYSIEIQHFFPSKTCDSSLFIGNGVERCRTAGNSSSSCVPRKFGSLDLNQGRNNLLCKHTGPALEDGKRKICCRLLPAFLVKKIACLQDHRQEHPVFSAWCAGLTEDLPGDVGTIEVPGERGSILIQPGHNGGAAYSQGRDGTLVPVSSISPAAAFYSPAMKPGWQKWMPATGLEHRRRKAHLHLIPTVRFLDRGIIERVRNVHEDCRDCFFHG